MKESREFYDRYWQREGGSPAEGGLLVAERKATLKSILGNLGERCSILDAGCGSGEFSKFMADFGHRVTSIDLSPFAIGKARKSFPHGRFAVASLQTSLPFSRHRRFGAIWCTEVLEHLLDVHITLVEFNRLLDPGGALILTVPYHGFVKNVLIALTSFETHYSPYLSHIRFFTRASLERCLWTAGFEPVFWKGIGRYWPVWMCQFIVALKKSAPQTLSTDIVG